VEGGDNMPTPDNMKFQYLSAAIKIAEATAGGGSPTNGDMLSQIIKKTYDQMIAIADTLKP
jgi:hypothetical protein